MPHKSETHNRRPLRRRAFHPNRGRPLYLMHGGTNFDLAAAAKVDLLAKQLLGMFLLTRYMPWKRGRQ